MPSLTMSLCNLLAQPMPKPPMVEPCLHAIHLTPDPSSRSPSHGATGEFRLLPSSSSKSRDEPRAQLISTRISPWPPTFMVNPSTTGSPRCLRQPLGAVNLLCGFCHHPYAPPESSPPCPCSSLSHPMGTLSPPFLSPFNVYDCRVCLCEWVIVC